MQPRVVGQRAALAQPANDLQCLVQTLGGDGGGNPSQGSLLLICAPAGVDVGTRFQQGHRPDEVVRGKCRCHQPTVISLVLVGAKFFGHTGRLFGQLPACPDLAQPAHQPCDSGDRPGSIRLVKSSGPLNGFLGEKQGLLSIDGGESLGQRLKREVRVVIAARSQQGQCLFGIVHGDPLGNCLPHQVVELSVAFGRPLLEPVAGRSAPCTQSPSGICPGASSRPFPISGGPLSVRRLQRPSPALVSRAGRAHRREAVSALRLRYGWTLSPP